jgi:hypothetical protein
MNATDTATDTDTDTGTAQPPTHGSPAANAGPVPLRQSPDTPGSDARTRRLHHVLRLLGQERVPGGDYYPADDAVLSDWVATKQHCRADRGAASDHLDTFLICHLETVRDLMVRACSGRAPGRLLDEIEAEAFLALQRSSS